MRRQQTIGGGGDRVHQQFEVDIGSQIGHSWLIEYTRNAVFPDGLNGTSRQ